MPAGAARALPTSRRSVCPGQPHGLRVPTGGHPAARVKTGGPDLAHALAAVDGASSRPPGGGPNWAAPRKIVLLGCTAFLALPPRRFVLLG